MNGKGAQPFKLFNLRVLPLFAACFILGIFCVKFTTWIAAIILVAAVLFLFVLWRTKSIERRLALILAVVLAIGYLSAATTLHFRNEVGLSGEQTVTCRVIDLIAGSDGTYTVKADYLRADGTLYVGKITFETEEPVSIGDRLALSGEVSIKTLSLDTLSSALLYRKGTKYALDSAVVLERSAGAPPLRHTIRSKILAVLTDTEGDRAGAFSYAMLFGDSEFMDPLDKEAMREVGIAHVIAVSGLHVGVLIAAILFLLRKLRLKDGVSLLILLPLLGFYAYLADFTPSVLRAAIMGLIALTASAIGERYDDVSALSLAAILILLFKPLYLFDLSFLLSFLAIFGLHSLSRPLERALLRRKCKPRLASGLALSLSTTVALVPVSAIVFGRVALAGIAMNLVVVPLASVTLVLTVLFLLPTLVFPSFGATLSVLSYLPDAIAEASRAVADLKLTADYDFSTAEVLLYYAILGFVGKYSLAKRRVKLVVAGVGVTVLLLLLFLA